MRIWLTRTSSTGFALRRSTSGLRLQAQNVQSRRQLGDAGRAEPAAQTRRSPRRPLLRTPEEFSNILLKVLPDGSAGQAARRRRVGLGAESFNID